MPILPPYEHPPEWIPHNKRYEHPDYDNDLRDYLPRVVTIRRERAEDTLGFIIRGGAEHCCGIFIGKVQPNSEANKHGMKEGDQILACNETSFENIDHQQAVRVLKSDTNTHLVVRFSPFAYRQTYERIPGTPPAAVPSPQQYPPQQIQYPPNQGQPQYQGEMQYPPEPQDPQYQQQQPEPQYSPQQTQYPDERQQYPQDPEMQYSRNEGPPEQYTRNEGPPEQYSRNEGPPEQYSRNEGPPEQYSRNEGPPMQYEQPHQYPEQDMQYLKQFLNEPDDQYVPYQP